MNEDENMNNGYKLGDMLKQFPMADLAKMIMNIVRFEPDVPKTRKDEIDAIEKAEKVSNQIIEDNL